MICEIACVATGSRRARAVESGQKNGPEPVREHQPGPSPTAGIDNGRGAPMVPVSPRRFEIFADGRREFDRDAFDVEYAHLDPVYFRWLLGRELKRFNQRPKIRKSLRHAVYERDGHACVTCGRTSRLTLDHIIPLSRGGGDTMDNLQTMCGSCNSRKADRI